MHSASFIKSVVLALLASHCAAGPIAKPLAGQDGPDSGNDLDERDVNIGTWIMTITPVTPTITTILVAPTTTPTQLEIPSELLPPPESKSQSHSKALPKPPPKPQSNSKSEPAPPPPPKGTKDAQNKSGPASAEGQSGPSNPPGSPANTATHDKGKPHSPRPPPPPPPAAASKTQAKGAPDACEDGEPAHNTVFDPVKVVVDPVPSVRNTFTLFGGPHPLIPHMTWRETVTTTLDEEATLPAQAGVDARNVHTTADPNSEHPILEVINPLPSTTQTLTLYRGAAPLHPHNLDRPTSTTTLGVPAKTPGCPPADKNPPPPPPPPPADTKNPPPPPPPAKPKSSKRPGRKKPRPSAPPAKSNNPPSNKPPPAPANTHTPAAAPPKKPPTPGTPPPPPAAQTKNPPPPPANSNKPAATPAADTTTKNKPTTTETKFYDEPIGGDPFHFHREPYSEASIVMPSDFEPTTTSTPKGTVTEVINPFWSVTVWVMGITTMVIPPTADLVTVTSVPGYTQLNPTSITPIPASYVAHHGTDPVPEQDSTTSSTTTTPPPPPPPPTTTSDSGFPQFLTLTGWPYFPPWTDPAIQWENDD